VDFHSQKKPLSIDKQVTFAAQHLFSAIIPPFIAAHSARFHRLTVNDCCARLGITANLLAESLAPGWYESAPKSHPASNHERTSRRFPRPENRGASIAKDIHSGAHKKWHSRFLDAQFPLVDHQDRERASMVPISPIEHRSHLMGTVVFPQLFLSFSSILILFL
jgi:hypothetical protein